MALPTTWTNPTGEEQAVGAIIPAIRFNKILGNLLKLGGTTGIVPACRATASAAQSIANATLTMVSFDTEDFDTDTIHDPTTNNTRLTCKTAGTYLIVGGVTVAANATGVRGISIKKNNTSYLGYGTPGNAGAGIQTSGGVIAMAALSVNDYVELEFYQSSGGALYSDRIAGAAPTFGMARVA